MKPLYESLDQARKRKISRRDFLKRAAALGLATPAVMAYLSACSPQAATPEAEQSARELLGQLTPEQAAADPLVMNGWSFLPEVVQNFQTIFNQQYGESASFEVIPGDYPATMLNKMIAKSPVDVMYSKLEAAKFFDAGWIIPLTDLPNYDIEQAKRDMWPAMLEILTYRDQLIGLPYYSSVKSMVWYNRIVLDQAGIGEADLPKTWDELYDVCLRLKRDGVVDIPIVMGWLPNANGIVHNWQAEAINRGDLMGDTVDLTITEDSGAAQTLVAWNKLYTEGLVPADSLIMGNADAQDIFMTGRAAFLINQSYQGKVYNAPDRSTIAGNALPLPRNGQSWGLFDYGGYAVINKPSALKMERAKRLVEFMGYKDKDGNIQVGKEWTIQAYLSPAYPAVSQDADIVAANKSWMPEYPGVDNIVQDLLANTTAPRMWKALWYPEFSTYLALALPDAVNGTRPVSEVIQGIRQRWDDLRKPYASRGISSLA